MFERKKNIKNCAQICITKLAVNSFHLYIICYLLLLFTFDERYEKEEWESKTSIPRFRMQEVPSTIPYSHGQKKNRSVYQDKNYY